jgi:hypothetical protein
LKSMVVMRFKSSGVTRLQTGDDDADAADAVISGSGPEGPDGPLGPKSPLGPDGPLASADAAVGGASVAVFVSVLLQAASAMAKRTAAVRLMRLAESMPAPTFS